MEVKGSTYAIRVLVPRWCDVSWKEKTTHYVSRYMYVCTMDDVCQPIPTQIMLAFFVSDFSHQGARLKWSPAVRTWLVMGSMTILSIE